jgi:hypothetical protein
VRYIGGVTGSIFQLEGNALRHDATSPNVPRQVPTGDGHYIFLKEALEIFLAHGRSVSERSTKNGGRGV